MKRYIIIAITLLCSTSCEDFLDKNPLDQISSETFWKTEKDVEFALAGVYSGLLSSTYNYKRGYWDAFGGNVFNRNNQLGSHNIAKGLIESTTGGWISTVYSDCYTGISYCNKFMENVDRVAMDESVRNKYKGEVLFLRALHYFTLTEFYGGVPVYTEPPTLENASIKQSTKAQVIVQVLTDLEFAISNLPNTSYEGHAVKASALALKAKVLLHNESWAEAAAAADLVIESGIFSLSNDYPHIFLTIGQTDNPEIIFSAQYLNPERYPTWGPDVEFGWWSGLNPTQEFVDSYECIDGLPINESSLYDPNNYKANRDPRLDYTVKLITEPIVNSAGSEYNEFLGSATGYRSNKYVNPESIPISYATLSDQDQILLRYADVLLMYAEAKNEASGPDQTVYDAINLVRARVNMPPLPTGLDKSEMRLRIMHERRVEFGLEGMRYQDLKRWRTAEAVLPAVVDPGGFTWSFDPSKHYLWPFPQSELDINTNLQQNPGY